MTARNKPCQVDDCPWRAEWKSEIAVSACGNTLRLMVYACNEHERFLQALGVTTRAQSIPLFKRVDGLSPLLDVK